MSLVTDGLAHYWNFRQGINNDLWENISPNKLDSVLANITGARLEENGLYFDGVDDTFINPSLAIPNESQDSNSNFQVNGFTLEFMIHTSVTNINTSLLGFDNLNELYVTNNRLLFRRRGGVSLITTANSFASNTGIFHVVLAYDGRSHSTYINGVRYQRSDTLNPLLPTLQVTFIPSIPMHLKFIRVYGRPLTPEEARQNYELGDAIGLELQPAIKEVEDLTVVEVQEDRAVLTWTPPQDAIAIRVYRNDELLVELPITETQLEDIGLLPNREYTYRVHTVYADEIESEGQILTVTTLSTPSIIESDPIPLYSNTFMSSKVYKILNNSTNLQVVSHIDSSGSRISSAIGNFLSNTSLAATPFKVAGGDSDLSLSSLMFANGLKIIETSSDLLLYSNLNVDAIKIMNTELALSSSTSLLGEGIKLISGNSRLLSILILEANGVKLIDNESNLLISHLLHVDGSRITDSHSSLILSPFLLVDGIRVNNGETDLISSSSIVAHGGIISSGQANLFTATILTANGNIVSLDVSADLSSVTNIKVNGIRVTDSEAGLHSDSGLLIDGELISFNVFADLSSRTNLHGKGTRVTDSTSDLLLTSDVRSRAYKLFYNESDLTSASYVTANGEKISFDISVNLKSSTSIGAKAIRIVSSHADLLSDTNLSATGDSVTFELSVNLSANTIVNASGNKIVLGESDIFANGELLTTGTIMYDGEALLISTTDLTVLSPDTTEYKRVIRIPLSISTRMRMDKEINRKMSLSLKLGV